MKEGEFHTFPLFPGRMLPIGGEPHHKVLGLRKGYFFPGNFVAGQQVQKHLEKEDPRDLGGRT